MGLPPSIGRRRVVGAPLGRLHHHPQQLRVVDVALGVKVAALAHLLELRGGGGEVAGGGGGAAL